MKLIIFDFDGVLVDTLLPCYEIMTAKNPDLPLDEYKNLFEGNIYDSLSKSNHNPHPDYFSEYEKRVREIKIPPKIKDLLKKLVNQNTLAVVSSTPSSLIRTTLEREDVSSYFTDILGNDVHSSKVVKIRMLLEKYKIKQEDVIFVTDTAGDILEGKECGIKSIGVTWGFHEKERLEKAGPVRVVDTPEDLAKAIPEFL